MHHTTDQPTPPAPTGTPTRPRRRRQIRTLTSGIQAVTVVTR